MRQILFAIFLLLLVSCSSSTSTDYVALVQKYNEAYEAQTKGDFPKASSGYKECINQCSMQQYADDDSVKLLLPKAMGQLMNTYQSQSDLTGCVAYSLSRTDDVQRAANLMNQALDMPLSYPTPERLFRDYAYASAVIAGILRETLSSFIQNDVKFAEIGTFFLYFGKKCFLCSRN